MYHPMQWYSVQFSSVTKSCSTLWDPMNCNSPGLPIHHQFPEFTQTLEKAMAAHSSTLAWKIPWTEEPGRLQSMGSLRVGHDWATSLSLSLTQTHVHPVSDAIQPSHPLLFPSPPAPNPSQHQGLFQWVNSLHQVARVLEFQL